MSLYKLTFTLLLSLLFQLSYAQIDMESFGVPNSNGINTNTYDDEHEDDHDEHEHHHEVSDTIPSIISTWIIDAEGAKFKTIELDTMLTLYHLYNPVQRIDLLPVTTGNIGGAYLYSDFFKRRPSNDFYFARTVEAYFENPSTIRYFNTTTPYTVLDYVQNFNKNKRAETMFNVVHSQNVNKDFNFKFFLNSDNSVGFYQEQEARHSNLGLATTYRTDKFNSHVSIIANRHKSEENGGLQQGQPNLNEYDETETFLVNLTNADSEVRSTIFSAVNEYKLGVEEEVEDEEGYLIPRFRPITGFLYKAEYARNYRRFTENRPDFDYFENTYYDSITTADSVSYNRFTNLFQIKFYENPDRKFTFSKRAYIANDIIRASMYEIDTALISTNKLHNTYVGGGIAREEGSFLTFDFRGKLYFTGYRAGQTELQGLIEKPLRIGSDTTTLSVEAELNSLVPDYFEQNYRSNHYIWQNNFSNINEMRAKATVASKRLNLDASFSYALISNYTYNNAEALPTQLNDELLVVSAYLNKDIATKNWFLRARLQWQQSSSSALHLPTLTGYLSVNWKFVLAGVLHNHIGFDVRYSSAFYADAYNPSTGQYHWQDQQKIGNYPVTNLHYNFKLKRARLFLQMMNATSGLLDGNYWSAPSNPLYRRSLRFGVAWSFYD